MMGVCPLGAQVRTLVGRSLMPDPSTNTISLFPRAAFLRTGDLLRFQLRTTSNARFG
jgi:hypothetical protein